MSDLLLDRPFREFLDFLGLTPSECSRKWEIPLRTVQHWTAGDRKCPGYVKFLIAEAAGLPKGGGDP